MRIKHSVAGIFPLITIIISIITTYPEARENSSNLYKKGAVLAMKGDIEGAIEIFKKVISISPYYALGHYGLGKAYLHKGGMVDNAIKHLKMSVNLDDKLSRGYFYLGIGLMFKRQYVHSLHAFDNAVKNDNDLIEALYNIGVIYDIMNSRLKAKKYFDLYNYKKLKGDKDIIF